MDSENLNTSSSSTANAKIKGIADFILIIRDRWLLSLTLALPVALAYIYV